MKSYVFWNVQKYSFRMHIHWTMDILILMWYYKCASNNLKTSEILVKLIEKKIYIQNWYCVVIRWVISVLLWSRHILIITDHHFIIAIYTDAMRNIIYWVQDITNYGHLLKSIVIVQWKWFNITWSANLSI